MGNAARITTMAPTADEPLFCSATAALAFAFSFSQGSPRTGLAAMQKPDPNRRPGRGLIGLDGAGQAGMILAEVGQMAKVRQSALAASFATRTSECACCGQQKPRDEWLGAIKYLAEASACAIAGVSHFRLRQAVLAKAIGATGETDEDLANRFNLDRKTVAKHRHAIKDWFRKIEGAAMREIDDRLRAVGMVGHSDA